MQQFDITIIDKSSRDNVVADLLSRLVINTNNFLIKVSFAYEYLFKFSIHILGYLEIANYLDARKFPSHVSPRERTRIIQQSTIFSWIDGYLF